MKKTITKLILTTLLSLTLSTFAAYNAKIVQLKADKTVVAKGDIINLQVIFKTGGTHNSQEANVTVTSKVDPNKNWAGKSSQTVNQKDKPYSWNTSGADVGAGTYSTNATLGVANIAGPELTVVDVAIQRWINGDYSNIANYEENNPTDITYNALAGEPIKLRIKKNDENLIITDYNWEITGTVVTNQAGDSLTDITNDSVEYYWTSKEGGATCTFKVDGKPITISRTFKVIKPKVSKSEVTLGKVGVFPVSVSINNKQINKTAFGLGPKKNLDCGIRFNFAVDAPIIPENYPIQEAGEWKYMQLVCPRLSVVFFDKIRICSEDYGTWQLDTSEIYAGVFSLDGKTQTTRDTPNVILSNEKKECEYDNCLFKMYVMYKPKVANAIYIPLKVVEWGFSGRIHHLINPPANKWEIIDDDTIVNKPKIADTLNMPKYSKICTSKMPTKHELRFHINPLYGKLKGETHQFITDGADSSPVTIELNPNVEFLSWKTLDKNNKHYILCNEQEITIKNVKSSDVYIRAFCKIKK